MAQSFTCKTRGANPIARLAAYLAAFVGFATGLPLHAAEQRELGDLSLEELSDLVVTSVSRRPESLALAASAIQVITADDLRRSGATSIPEALRLAPNLQVAQVNGNNWAVSARGFNSTLANKLLVMVDGRTIYSPLFAGVFWESQDVPLYDIERIEVISGPGGTLWGANAVNGVINIVTRSSSETQGLLLRAGGGDEVQALGAARFGGALGSRGHFRVYGQYSRHDGPLLANGADAPNDSHLGQGGFRMDLGLTDNDALTVQGDANEVRTNGVAADAVARTQNILSRWTRRFSETSELQLQAYYDHAERLNPGSYTDELATFDVELQQRMRVATAHELVWGLTYRAIQDHFGNQLFAMDPARITLHRVSGFVQDEIALAADSLHLTVGTKVEDNEYTGAEWQPSIRLAWRYKPGVLVWSAVSRAVRTPSRFERDLNNGTSPPFTLGSDRYDSEKLTAYELGVRLHPMQALSVSLATYYNDYNDIRSFEPVGLARVPVLVSNGLEGHSHGAELSVEYRPSTNWQLHAGYAYLDLQQRRKAGSRDAQIGAVEARDWNHQAFLRASIELPRDLELDGTVRHIGRIDNYRLPAYTEADVRLGWKATATLELSVNGRNLLHSSHGEFGPPGRQEIERSVYALLEWQP